MPDKEAVSLIFDIALKVRVHREWQNANAVFSPEFTERELLVLEIIQEYPPMTEKALAKVLGLSPSTVHEVCAKLENQKLIEKSKEKSRDGREKPLKLTEDLGVKILLDNKRGNAQRYEYMLSKFTSQQLEDLKPMLKLIDETVTTRMMQDVFNR